MSSVPKPLTLALLVGDTVNSKGQVYVISAVAAGVDDSLGRITYAVTIPTKILTLSAYDTVLESTNQAGQSIWIHSSKS